MIVEQMAFELGIPVGFVASLARTASHEYKTYSIPKRSGGMRIIHHPSRRLKALQRWLLLRSFVNLPIHPSAMAYRTGISIFDNAKVHASSRYLLRMDFEDFFHSISKDDVEKYISERPTLFKQWSSADIEVVCGLICRNGALTIGAPTSPIISNALCYELDSQLYAMSVQNDVRYTRYADDLFFSTDQPNVLRNLQHGVSKIIAAITLPAKIKINATKTRHSSRKGARRVTGIVLGSDGRPYLGRHVKRKVRALIHKYQSLDMDQRASLAGLIAYATGIDPQFMNNLIDKYGLKQVNRAKAG